MIVSFRGFGLSDARVFYADNEARRMKVILVTAAHIQLYHARLEIEQWVDQDPAYNELSACQSRTITGLRLCLSQNIACFHSSSMLPFVFRSLVRCI